MLVWPCLVAVTSTNIYIYIGNVSRYVREKDLRNLFSRYGRIRDLILRVGYCAYVFIALSRADLCFVFMFG